MSDSLDVLEDLDLDLDLPPPGAGGDDGTEAAGPVFFGTYQLIQEVGVGGVARVYRARHIHPSYENRAFAIKILHDELSRDPAVVELFRHEAYVLSLLKHPNIVETFEAGSQDDRLFIAMDYIDGRDLDNMMIRCQKMRIPLPIPVVLHIVVETLKGLAYAHGLRDADDNHLRLVHRDINPANVFLSFDGRVKLGDFGVASITAGSETRRLAGKAGYFAPEQLEGGSVDHRADLFAVSVMLFEMLCGVRLFQADSVEELIKLNKKAKVPKPSKINPSIPPELEQVVLRGLERKPSDRFSDGAQMLGALQHLAPQPVGMPLGVAALMRKAFSSEHIQELQIRDGLAGASQTRGSGQLVGICTADPRALAAFKELLSSRGYRVATYDSLQTLAPALGKTLLNALLIDVGMPDFSDETLRTTLTAAPQPVPVVGFAEALEVKVVKAADRIGAADLLFKPYNIERVLTAVRSTIAGGAKVATVDPTTAVAAPRAKPKVLILSKDPGLITRLTRGLVKRGYEVEVSPSVTEALERTRHSSHHAVVYDAHPASPADRFFANQFRGQPGMGLVPILYLASPESQSIFAGVDADRSAVRPRMDPPVVAVETLNRLRGDNRLGRTFVRYHTEFPIEMRYGGRVFSGTVCDVSRGGVMLTGVQQMPPVGTEVGLAMQLPGVTSPVQVHGRVARVDLPNSDNPRTMVGVEFESFASSGESALIAYLGSLGDPTKSQRQTLIIPQPPGLAEGE